MHICSADSGSYAVAESWRVGIPLSVRRTFSVVLHCLESLCRTWWEGMAGFCRSSGRVLPEGFVGWQGFAGLSSSVCVQYMCAWMLCTGV
jgi:hypothetical protein